MMAQDSTGVEVRLKSAIYRSLVAAYKNILRPISPGRRAVQYSGIKIAKDRVLFDAAFPRFSRNLKDIPSYEPALIEGIRRHTVPGDTVVVVGGGWGVTAIAAALVAGPKGRVVCFEGGAESVAHIQEGARRNGVADRIAVEHAVVGESFKVYGNHIASRVVHPAELPTCDVLQLDCEGAEIAILRGLIFKPRVIVVETHGMYGAGSEIVSNMLKEKGYTVEALGVAEIRSREYCVENDIMVLTARLDKGVRE